MKYKFILIASLILAILAMGAVSAADSPSEGIISDSENNVLEIGETNVYTDYETGSFTDLQSDINNCAGNVLDIQRNYRFNNETDSDLLQGITIDRDDFVINGNGYTIDGDDQSGIFTIDGVDITINNLTFINANSNRGSVLNILTNCSLTTNDVVFENNTANVGVIFVFGDYISNGDKFIDSTSSNYAVVVLYSDGSAYFNNSLMMCSKQLDWGFIYALDNSLLIVANSTFANTTSKYTTAIRGNKVTVVENSKFINLHANVSAGAIGVKCSNTCTIDKVIINNCTFINVTSEKNAGAILADVFNAKVDTPVTITNSNFIDCYSGFGGALMQYGGTLTINNCNFTNNSALFDGGAIYTSYALVNILKSIFDENYVEYEGTDRPTYGGTIFCDMGGFNFHSSALTNSHAQYGAIYLYDSNYNIVGNVFDNNLNLNGDYNDIFTVFDGNDTGLANNKYSGDNSYSLNNINYETIINATGMQLTLINNTIDVTGLPSRFDLRDWGWVTPVRDQGRMGSCWAFGTSGAIESAILRFLGLEFDVSENNMQDLALQYNMYGTNGLSEGGTVLAGSSYALSWFGVFSSDYDTYDEFGKISPIIAAKDSIHFQDVVFIAPRKDVTDNDALKEALLKYGALGVGYYAEQEPPYYNPETGAQYCNESLSLDHVVTLIGWDDSYSASNFLITPPGDGAWIFKNSWGESAGIGGYFYISYYDLTFQKDYPAVAFLLENTVEYNKNYQYDIGGFIDIIYSSKEYANIFEAVEDDYIAGVGTYFMDDGVPYTVEVYINDELELNQSGVSPFAGFHTIQLDSFIAIEQGDVFAVKITSDSVPLLANSRQHYIKGLSRYLENGVWVNASDYGKVCSIKVYTVDEIGPQHNTTLVASYYSANNIVMATLTDDEGDVITNADVVMNIDGDNYTVKTNSAGQAKISTEDLDPGIYSATIYYAGNSQYGPSETSFDFTIKADTYFVVVDVFAEYDDVELVATLVNNATGKSVKGATVAFKINGKVYKAKTDMDGRANVTVSGLAPNTYEVIVSYNGNTKYNGASETFNVVVNKITTSIVAYYDSQTNEIVAILINDMTGQFIKGGTVGMVLNGVKTLLKTDVNGIARFAIGDADPNAISATLSYSGNSKYLATNAKINTAENKAMTAIVTVYDEEAGEIVATLFNTVTNQFVKGGTVGIVVNGVKNIIKTDMEGEARLSIADLDPGVYSVVSSYSGNTKYTATNQKINIVKI